MLKLIRYLTACIALTSLTSVVHAGPVQRDYPFRPVPFTAVKMDSAFWGPRLTCNREVTVWYDFDKCEETARIDNFAVAGKLQQGGFTGIYFNDSDVYKVIEGAAYSLALEPDPKLDHYLDELIAKIAAAQETDGYLYTARTINDPKYNFPGKNEGRWSRLDHGHELYNVGHMYEAAVAYYRATGKKTLLDVAIKNADLICRVFGPSPGQRIDVPGHEEIEIGLVRLYRVTGDEKYLRQAKFFIDMRGRKDLRKKVYGEYCQDHVPVVDQTEAVGHAVRGGYLYAGVADVAAITGDRQYIAAIDRIWQDVMDCKMYLTGGVGQHGAGEGYAGAWKLDNVRAYNETCAAIALALWNERMFMLHGEAKYIDVLERILYNGFLSGVSLTGNRFFYPNPLACDMQFKFNQGSFERSPWFGCSCCPVNIVRFLPSIPGMIYAMRDHQLYINLYAENQATVDLAGTKVQLQQHTKYPWNGVIDIVVNPERAQQFTLKLRAPGWARGRPVPSDLYRYTDPTPDLPAPQVNGQPVNSPIGADGYWSLQRQWHPGDTIRLAFPMPPHRVAAHQNVEPDRGRVAIERGPIVYCAEGADHNGHVLNLVLPDTTTLTPDHRPDLLDGVTVLTGKALAATRGPDNEPATSPTTLTLIPYYAWCNRGPNEMQVWLPRTPPLAKLPPIPTIATESKISVSYCYPPDSPRALNDQQEPKSSGDHSLARLTWWPHKGTREWTQYEFDKPHKVTGIDVYWFDDSGRGGCRIPAGWRVYYRTNGQWKTAHDAPTLEAHKDAFNTLNIDPITTNALKIEIDLQNGFSGGVLEWRVRGER